jgi:hypothetical protein
MTHMPVDLALGVINKLRSDTHAGTSEVNLKQRDTITRVVKVDCVQCLVGCSKLFCYAILC